MENKEMTEAQKELMKSHNKLHNFLGKISKKNSQIDTLSILMAELTIALSCLNEESSSILLNEMKNSAKILRENRNNE
jgi:ATP-dependent Zn protease